MNTQATFFDPPIEELRQYKPDVREPKDFDEFWQRSLQDNPVSRDAITMERAARHFTTPDVFDVSFPGYGGVSLRYFDSVNVAKQIKGPGLFSVGLMDPIAPPSTVFAAYNHFAGDAEIVVYTFSGHVGGVPWQI